LDYIRQVESKRQILEEIFRHRFPQASDIPITMRASAQPYGYRSRARIQLRGCGAGAFVGFFRCGSHAVEDIEECPLFRPSLNEALRSLRQYKLKVDTDPKPQEMDMACSEEEDTWATTPVGAKGNEASHFDRHGMKEDVILRKKSVSLSIASRPPCFSRPMILPRNWLRSFGTAKRRAGTLDLFAERASSRCR
jgi:hypothetical protein